MNKNGGNMFKFIFIYSIVLLTLFWLASDVKVEASLYKFEDNYIEIDFPSAWFRTQENSAPWFSFTWNAASARDELQDINDAIVK